MKDFKDAQGRTWDIAINVTSIKRLRDKLELDLLAVVEGGDVLGKLVTDPVLLVDVVYVLCEAQAEERKVTDEDFGRAMAGEAIDAATKALLEDLISFFPRARQRGLLKEALATIDRLEKRVFEVGMKRLTDGTVEKMIDAELQKTSGVRFTDVPASSASTPAP